MTDPDVMRDIKAQEKAPDFTLVEIGHGLAPIAGHFTFTGTQRYIGIESWSRDFTGAQRELFDIAYHRHNERLGHGNVYYLTRKLGKFVASITTGIDAIREIFDSSGQLKDAIASRVFASNVLSDHMVANDPGQSDNLLRQMGRLVAERGFVILRETFSPTAEHYVDDNAIAKAGLKLVATVGPADPEWPELEHSHRDSTRQVDPNSFYAVLRRSDRDEAA